MKILFDHPFPFALAHGGFQIQIEQTMAALQRRGAEVEHVRWWDDKQTGDVIHYLGRPSGAYIDFAHAKGTKVIVGELLSGLGSRSAPARFAQKSLMTLSQLLLPATFTSRMGWEAYRKADGFVANTASEASLMQTMFGADPAKIAVIANGVEEVFFQRSGTQEKREDYLVCTATIHPRKRVVETAEAAAAVRVPLRVVGRPYAESDPYYRRFLEVQGKHKDLIRYEGAITDRAELAAVYQKARGFVLLSQYETHSLSAFEAAAAGCPMLLSDLPWARDVFGSHARYVPVASTGSGLAAEIGEFYRQAPSMPAGIRPPSWDDIADQFLAFYCRAGVPA